MKKTAWHSVGAINKLSKIDFSHLTVINGDIVSDIDFESLNSFHIENNNDITTTVANYSHQIPFGVVKFDENYNFQSLFEKPFYSFLYSVAYIV